MKLADYVIDFIAGQGVKQLFMLPGGGCMHLADAVCRNKEIEFVGCLHEQACVIAADGYAQYSGRLGAALVTTGPGSTNAITGVAGAFIDSTPLIILSGQTKRSDLLVGSGLRQLGIQEVDIVSLVKPITKYAITVTEPGEIRFHLEKAVFLAKSGRPGPVWLDLPLDVQGAEIDEKNLTGFPIPQGKAENFSKEAERVVALLYQAKQPVILAGRGIRLSGGLTEFEALIRRLNIPVLTTWRAMDYLAEDDPLFLGRPGSIASRGANFIQQNADLILILGARLDRPQIGHNFSNFAPKAKKIIVDIDQAEIDKISSKVDLIVRGDVSSFLKSLNKATGGIAFPAVAEWVEKCRAWKNKYPVILPEYLKPADKVNTYALLEVLSNLMTAEDVLVPESSGTAAEMTPQSFKIKAGQRAINSPGLGCMGFGLPQSLGVCLASARKRTIAIIGDGALQHNIQELETLKRLNLPIKVFILNNQGYASIRATHNRFFDGRLVCCDNSSGLTLPDTIKVARAYGLTATKISHQHSLENDVAAVLALPGPVICEVEIEPNLEMAPKLSSQKLADGTMVSKPLEDLWPFLPANELEENMR